MNLHGIYALTDEHLLPDPVLVPAAERALAAGITLLQYRNKLGDSATRRRQAVELLDICRRYSVPLIINDDIELCADIGADGVHLGQQDGSLSAARKLLGSNALIGITCHQSLDLALSAESEGANYVAFGRFYPSSTKPGAPAARPEILTEANKQLTIPMVAIGGVNAENGGSLITAGADMLAVVGGIFGSDDIEGNVTALRKLFSSRQEAL